MVLLTCITAELINVSIPGKPSLKEMAGDQPAIQICIKDHFFGFVWNRVPKFLVVNHNFPCWPPFSDTQKYLNSPSCWTGSTKEGCTKTRTTIPLGRLSLQIVAGWQNHVWIRRNGVYLSTSEVHFFSKAIAWVKMWRARSAGPEFHLQFWTG